MEIADSLHFKTFTVEPSGESDLCSQQVALVNFVGMELPVAGSYHLGTARSGRNQSK